MRTYDVTVRVTTDDRLIITPDDVSRLVLDMLAVGSGWSPTSAYFVAAVDEVTPV